MAALQTEETTPSTATADQSLNLWALMDALRTSGPGGNSALVSGDSTAGEEESDDEECVTKEDVVEAVVTEPVLECRHGSEQRCHNTYLTEFQPASHQVCRENFEKVCQISFRGEAAVQTVRRCSRPLVKTCDGRGEPRCRLVFETSCTTRTGAGEVRDTECEQVPVEVCGAGCVTEPGPQQCTDQQVETLVQVPDEFCDIVPQQSCSQATKLVPRLRPKQECTAVPTEVCAMNYSRQKLVKKPLKTEWCRGKENNIKSLQEIR